MPDERHGDSGVAIDFFLKRKDHEHPSHEFFEHFDPAGPAGPDLRADVVIRRNARVLSGLQHPSVETVIVDANKRRWPAVFEEVLDPRAKPPEKWNACDGFPKSSHAQR